MAALILASASPRRRGLLGRICPAFTVVPADVDESLDPGPVAAAVERLALRKARAVASGARDAVVLAADTVVVVDGVVLGKPAGPAEARAMLRRLRGRVHEVVTGVAVVDAAGREASLSVTTRVLMAAYSDATLHAYAASGAPLDKAGAYAIQDRDGALVDGLAGSYTNVVGLPLEATRRLLEGFGVRVSAAAGP
ncbi:MAG: septum formation protein Maf [Candidatus Rokubacteria bacterium]|nr:septum formation protein Maf [Candidatus Rokubacteria bacterium]